MSKYYLDLTNFSTGYAKLAGSAVKAIGKGDIEKSGINLAKLNYKLMRREPRDPKFNKGTRLQRFKMMKKLERPLRKLADDPDKVSAVGEHMENRYPKLMKAAEKAYR